MQLIPFEVEKGRYNVFVVLEDANVYRILKDYDPAQFSVLKLPPEWQARKLDTVIIGYANPQDLERVAKLIAQGDATAALAYLSRGFTFRPEAGDNDAPYGDHGA